MLGVTGSTGQLGRLVIKSLLERGVAAGEIVALARDPGKAGDFAASGVQVRRADYNAPESLPVALAGVDRLLLISGNELGQRVTQHSAVVEAARQAGVKFIAYTSIPKADTNAMLLAREHRATESLIRESGIPFSFLRNSWYLELYTDNLSSTIEHGVLPGAADDGQVSAATRADLAAAAAAVLAGPNYENRIFELGGDEAFTLAELARTISEVSGRAVEYRNLPEEAYLQTLVGVGLPEEFARIYADSDRGIARGELRVETGDLSQLIGRPTTTAREAIAAALA
jgi:NAD(P)H dehydrogenase (quinone)